MISKTDKESPQGLDGHLSDPHACAFNLLRYRPRSRREMVWRLGERGFGKEVIDSTIKALEKRGLIDDRLLATELMRGAIERRHLGRRGVEEFLYHRGIDKEVIDDVLSGYAEDTEKDTARRFIEKKLKTLQNYPPETLKRKLAGMLRQRGFSFDVINKVLQNLPSSE